MQAIDRAPRRPGDAWGGGGSGGGGGNPNAAAYRLTPLGVHLGRLPLDPRVGKMLLLAALTGCLHPILTVAAAPQLGCLVHDRRQSSPGR